MVKVSFVGDIMCEQEQLIANKIDNNFDFSHVFKEIKSVFNDSDFVVGNLETPIAGEELAYTNHKWSFNSPVEFAIAVKEAGFDLVATANNHCLDRGIDGVYNSMRNLKKINLDYTGTSLSKKDSEILYFKEIKGIKTAFISYTYGTNASFNNVYLDKKEKHLVNLFRKQEKQIGRKQILSRILARIEHTIIKGFTFNKRLNELRKKIKEAKKNADVVYLLMHSGGQYNIVPDKWTVSLMNFLFKNKVDAVIGCHPHVVQKVIINEKNQIGAFSLGNFCSYPGSESCKMNKSEYSIILHTYLNEITKKMYKFTFQITKSVIDKDGRATIHLVNDLIKNEIDIQLKNKLLSDNLLIVNRFLNQSLEVISLEEEYLLFKQE
jgi:poly-gamma-glutamate capsule biosynthesis protein CapA/YwtB (metallophosphatase superfamily)